MDLLEFMQKNKKVMIAEGYVFEFIRRGKVRAGSLVPEVVLDDPESVRALHQEFVDAGSDVVQAFTYYANREKMRDVGREGELEVINKNALRIAKEVARRNGKLFAGGLCNSNIYDPDCEETIEKCLDMFTEQCKWAKEAGVDYMIAETFWDYGEASLALKVIKDFDMVAVVSICPVSKAGTHTYDGIPVEEALRRLEEEGADVVCLNCQRGPQTLIPLMKKCREVCQGYLGCLPVCYKTDESTPTMTRLKYHSSNESCYPHDLHIHNVSHKDIRWFAEQCEDIGIDYLGLCCGNDPGFTKTLALAMGKDTKLQKYASDRTRNSIFGNGMDTAVRTTFQEFCIQ